MWQGQSPEEKPGKATGEGVVSDVVRTLGYWRFQDHWMTMMTMDIIRCGVELSVPTRQTVFAGDGRIVDMG